MVNFETRIVEGVVRDSGGHGLIIITDEVKDTGWGVEELFDGRLGRRVRVTVEVVTETAPTAIRKVTALKPGQIGQRYVVGTFPAHKGSFRAYLHTYNPTWNGCVQYDVIAGSGKEAKRAAINARKTEEQF